MFESTSICLVKNRGGELNGAENPQIAPLISGSDGQKVAPVAPPGFVYLRRLGDGGDLICLKSDRLYTVGRACRGRGRGRCHIVLGGRRISRYHCQLFLDGLDRKLRLVDGRLLPGGHDPLGIRRSFWRGLEEGVSDRPRVSLNGVFINGHRLQRGVVAELSTGDEILLGCRRSSSGHDCGEKHGFLVERFVFSSDATEFSGSAGNICHLSGSEFGDFAPRAAFLLSQSRRIMQSSDPISYLRSSLDLHHGTRNVLKTVSDFMQNEKLETVDLDSEKCCKMDTEGMNDAQWNLEVGNDKNPRNIEGGICSSQNLVEVTENDNCNGQWNLKVVNDDNPRNIESGICSSQNLVDVTENDNCNAQWKSDSVISCYSDGSSFSLNCLESMDPSTSHHCAGVNLQELLHPIQSLVRVFITTFTCDVYWFLSYCQVPNHLPVTIACHSSERCWSASHTSRTLAPCVNYPNLLLVFPPFPDIIAFGKDRKKGGVACHHPKLIILQREDRIRIIVTSANLVSKQWNYVTNTVWCQDFPRQSEPDYSALFGKLKDSKSDFAAQLAGFVASLITDVPSQAHWIKELVMYDFGGAACHLVASVPGIHMQNIYFRGAKYYLSSQRIMQVKCNAGDYLGSVQASVVGLSHRFRAATDSSGSQLKNLASILGKCQENVDGTVEVLLKRNLNIPADSNAVSVLVADLKIFHEGDTVQLGFLPKDVAKWVSCLSDTGFFSFSAFIYPKEALASAFDSSNVKVQLLLYVLQGPKFFEISKLIENEHYASLSSLLASIQRCLGLWRLEEVLSQYNWPDSLETDFSYGASSIGTSVNFRFLSAFSAAAGKRSSPYPESDESDPEWGCWTASNEQKRPSLRILFPTIKRVKDAHFGIQLSKRMISLSEKTWERLRTVGVFHDAVPQPCDRLGHPMHVKVAQRRFRTRAGGSSSFGWIYCGSHNFSPAAWGQMLLPSSESKVQGASMAPSVKRLHICNYELGIILVVPPPSYSAGHAGKKLSSLDDVILPFMIPAPKYQHDDRPATAKAMREVSAQVGSGIAVTSEAVTAEEMDGDVSDDEEEDILEESSLVEEKAEERIYAEMLWSEMDSSES